jgi:hypothetical protein
MITPITLALYFLLVLGYVLTYFFIIYHLMKYSLHPSLNNLILPVFVIGSVIILFTNIVLFSYVDWNGLFSSLVSTSSY